MLFELLLVGLVGYGTYKGTKGMWRRAKQAHWAWGLLIPVLGIILFFMYMVWVSSFG
ncbi:hypothetical protein SECTIM467_1 [Brevibacillus phage SecTim467]|uniref:Uncharacterized protein n=2 Tax=Jenstvirus jenst TaxID=1982225 RepID=A0A0K2CPL1_9CAUD|nr:hypothetical protein AVV11_gp001 [Brevibacillus phage Jenst]ALA07131.1 hypothetical protein JENST_1 [Brevibacillus phage Jenst]ALA07504.1 hypothetical protein SECTIM467_1 [Brevibacillus phage SecTim467]